MLLSSSYNFDLLNMEHSFGFFLFNYELYIR